MPRTRPDDRFRQLIAAAIDVFIAQGYRRTQVADIASALGLAKGTLYLYVDSKQTLFDLAVRHVDRLGDIQTPEVLPVRGTDPGETLRFVAERLAVESELPALAAAMSRRRVSSPRVEVEGIVRELYAVLARNRVGLKLIDRCAPDYPDLAALHYGVARHGLPVRMRAYLDARARRPAYRSFTDTAVAARMVVETVAFWAVHRHWDPSPQIVDEASAEATVVEFLCGALLC